MKPYKKTLATTGLILMAGFFLMITISSPAQELPDTEGRVEQQMRDKPPGQELLPDDPIQQDMRPDMDSFRLLMEDISEKSLEKSPGVRFTVDSDALINRLTVGRGGGDKYSNTVVGDWALFSNTTGFNNTAIGQSALYHNTIGFSNTAIGASTLSLNTTGNHNTAIGPVVLVSNTTGTHNTAIGAAALRNNTSGSFNTASGGVALNFNTSGSFNTASGYRALYSNIANSRSTAIGFKAMRYADNRTTGRDTYNTAVGYQALRGSETAGNNTGRWNTAIGDQALYSNTSGNFNTASGHQALRDNTEGNQNTAIGLWALRDNTEGNENTAIGMNALQVNTEGNQNTAIGRLALLANRANSRSTAIGYEAMRYADNRTTGRDTYNTAVGYQALKGSEAAGNNTGRWNTAIGDQALYSNTSGNENTAIGYMAGVYRSNISRGTFIGKSAYASVDGLTNVTGIGYGARPTESNQVWLGNEEVTWIGGWNDWYAISDGKYKSKIEDKVKGLDFILKLRPVTYQLDVQKYKAEKENMHLEKGRDSEMAEPSETNQNARDDQSPIIYSGFIAQEVEIAANESGYEFSGVRAPKNDNGLYSLSYAKFVVPIVKAIQEQQRQIESLSPEGMDELLGKVDALEADNVSLTAEQKALQQANESLITEQEALRAENVQMRGQISDILDLLAALGVEIQQCCNNHSRDIGHESDDYQLPMEDHAQLKQNAPNPFQENTLIRYYLPKGFQKASIIITDLSGNMVKSFSLSGYGHGQILISGGTMKAGTYIYTLISDGRQVDSKRMVLL